MPLKDLATATGLARAKVHRYLTSFATPSSCRKNLDTGQYQIGPASVAIGLVGLRRISPVAEVCAALPALRDLINQTVTVAVWSEAGPVVVAMQESDHWITMNIRIGSRLPILTTAIGRTFLAHLPDAVVRPLVASERKEAQAHGTAHAVKRGTRRTDQRNPVAAIVARAECAVSRASMRSRRRYSTIATISWP